MITQLAIQGFKSFGPSVETRLNRLNFIVGANASGKTNLLSALRFVQCALASNIEQAIGEFGGKTEVWNKIQREKWEAKHLELKLSTDSLGHYENHEQKRLEVSHTNYSLKVELPYENGPAAIVGEHLVAALKGENGPVRHYQLHRTRNRLEIEDPSDARFASGSRIDVPPEEHTRSAVAGGLYSRPALLLREHIKSWAFYNLNAEAGRQPSRDAETALLGTHGENLSTVLHEIEARGGASELKAIVDGLRGVVPGFAGLHTVSLPFEAKWGFQIHEEKLRSALNPQSASDGTIRLLLLMVVACWSAKKSALVAIEEPENGLHPFLAEQLVNMFRRASAERQFLITTHNPYFLDHLAPEELLLCDKRDGFTTLQRAADIAEIEGFRKHFSLGELWTQGRLGGIP